MSEILFTHPITLFREIHEVLRTVGPEKFFSSPKEEIKKAREGLAGFFFMLTLKKMTGNDWWMAQYDQSEREFPDFDLISLPENENQIELELVELLTITNRFTTFKQVMMEVLRKQKKYNYEKCNLLIFLNTENSEQWVSRLNYSLENKYPFRSIWTIHLLFKNIGKDMIFVAHRVRPYPILRIETSLEEAEILKPQSPPSYVDEVRKNGRTYIVPRSELVKELTKTAKRAGLSRQ